MNTVTAPVLDLITVGMAIGLASIVTLGGALVVLGARRAGRWL